MTTFAPRATPARETALVDSIASPRCALAEAKKRVGQRASTLLPLSMIRKMSVCIDGGGVNTRDFVYVEGVVLDAFLNENQDVVYVLKTTEGAIVEDLAIVCDD